MSKKLVLHSGGMDSTANMLTYIDVHGAENVISLGFNYGQRHFEKENAAATAFCEARGVKRIVLDIPIGQIGGCSLVDHDIPVTTDMAEQRSTVVPMRNGIFIMIASAVAQVQGCDVIVHGACEEDYAAYRDCRSAFFRLLEAAIQAGITEPTKGSENIKDDRLGLSRQGEDVIDPEKVDIRIETPLVFEKKEDTVARILEQYDVSVYSESYTCYNGDDVQCGRCPACVERQVAFYVNNVEDPLPYKNPLSKDELEAIVEGAAALAGSVND
jgi:7-cyano-7-deazaguanine synthase